MKRIDLYLTATGWVARFVDDPEVQREFGTDTIPTAFSAMADPLRVLRAIRNLNPGSDVRIV